MIKPPVKKKFVLIMTGTDGVPVELSTSLNNLLNLSADINQSVKVLYAVQFRGTITFTISCDGDLFWTSIITFTDDIPTGIWNNTDHHAK